MSLTKHDVWPVNCEAFEQSFSPCFGRGFCVAWLYASEQVFHRWAQQALATKLPSEARGRCLLLLSKALRTGSSLSRCDLVDVQSKESHTKAAEQDEKILTGERHRIDYKSL